jgi:hypothetical protein
MARLLLILAQESLGAGDGILSPVVVRAIGRASSIPLTSS